MSTKIYDGFKIDHVGDLHVIDNIMKRAREKLSIRVKHDIKRAVKETAKQKNITENEALIKWLDLVQSDPDLEWMFSFSVVLFAPIDSPTIGITYGPTAYRTIFLESSKCLSDYGYWDNVDPDETVSEAEWDLREQHWKRALPGNGIPAAHGFTFEVIRPVDIIMDMMFK